ncbi:hypothetical protein J1605_001340 [Eschrichtius robustus]|uniref:G protein-coupled receptor kinase n=1 Tax=Eschrichtius robustus TaxID=9764 RepID=A0AB34GAI4_ESCRO|nr:hypothetical protein J1605_001340 [Eschrichtius robustus]
MPLSHFLTATWSFVCDFILSVLEAPWKIGVSLLLARFAEYETTKEHTPVEESQLLISDEAGTNGYMAPEILMEKVSYSYPVDWFAMGCSIYEMVAGRTPFKDYKEKVSKEDLKQRTLKEEVRFQHDNFTEEAKDICRLFLAKTPEQHLGSREKSDDPRKHHFFKTINFPLLEAGLVEPPFVLDPSVVYAKDIDEIEDFSEVRGVEFDDKDTQFFQRFATGAVPVAWQEEIIETGLFAKLNDPNRPTGCGEGDSSKSANSNPQLQDNINHIWNKEEETPMEESPGLEHLPLACSSSILSELLEAPNPTLETLWSPESPKQNTVGKQPQTRERTDSVCVPVKLYLQKQVVELDLTHKL